MRFMVIVKANERSEAGKLPTEQELAAMGRYNEELVKAGIMVAGEGLQASSRGVRVRFGPTPTVTEGPFGVMGELISGFWIWDVKSRDEAIEWLKRAPFPEGDEVELRKVFEAADFAPSDPTGELRKKEEALRKQVEGQR